VPDIVEMQRNLLNIPTFDAVAHLLVP